MATIYQNVDVKQKSFTMGMSNKEGAVVGQIKLKIMFSTEQVKKEGEESKENEMVPAGGLAAAAQ